MLLAARRSTPSRDRPGGQARPYGHGRRLHAELANTSVRADRRFFRGLVGPARRGALPRSVTTSLRPNHAYRCSSLAHERAQGFSTLDPAAQGRSPDSLSGQQKREPIFKIANIRANNSDYLATLGESAILGVLGRISALFFSVVLAMALG